MNKPRKIKGFRIASAPMGWDGTEYFNVYWPDGTFLCKLRADNLKGIALPKQEQEQEQFAPEPPPPCAWRRAEAWAQCLLPEGHDGDHEFAPARVGVSYGAPKWTYTPPTIPSFFTSEGSP